VTVNFATDGASLTHGAKRDLSALAKVMPPGASVSVTGCAPGNAPLSRNRATAVEYYLRTRVRFHVSISTVTTTLNNSAIVVLTKK